LSEREPHPFEAPVADRDPESPLPGAPPRLQLKLVLLGVLLSFLTELAITAGTALIYIGVLFSDQLDQPELIFWQVTGSPFLRMVSALSGLPSTMLGGYVAARKAQSRPRSHGVLVAALYAGILTAVAELVLSRSADSSSDYIAYASTISGTIVGGLLGGLFAARGRKG
jgi:uncharacterized membrane protein